MNDEPMKLVLYEMRLTQIYEKHDWLSAEIALRDFIALFPLTYHRGRPVMPDRPSDFDIDRNIFLEILLAYRQSFS